MYFCFLNVWTLYHYESAMAQARQQKRVIYEMPAIETTPRPCFAWSQVALILAPSQVYPLSNDPSEALRALMPVKRMLKRLVNGKSFLAVSLKSYMPSHTAWCERIEGDTAHHVSCSLLLADNSTLASAVEALQRAQPCLAGALVIIDPSAVDSGLLHRLAGVSYQNYSCLALSRWQQPCPVFYLPLRAEAG